MADLIITERENITAVADKIRSLTGETNEITLGEMIENVETANNDKKTIIATLNEYGNELDENAPISEVAKTSNMQKVYDSGYTKGENIWISYCLQTGEHFDLPESMIIIPEYMFSEHSNLKTVSIPTTIKTIENTAFSFSSVQVKQFPENLETIGYDAFIDCVNNDVIVFSPSITAIQSDAFCNNTNLTEVTFVKTGQKTGTPTTLNNTAFLGCPNLTIIRVPWSEGEVAGAPWGAENATIVYNYWDTAKSSEVFTFPEGFIKIPSYLFYNETKTTAKEIYLNNDCEEIGDAAFYKASNLETVHFPDGLKKIGQYGFRDSPALKCSELPDSVEEIGNRTFEDSAISLTKLPANIKELGTNCFAGCSGNTFTEIPEGIVRISARAFWNNTGLTKLTFLNTPEVDFIEKGIARDAFEGCTNLTDIYVPWKEGEVKAAPWGAVNATIHYEWRNN